MRKEIGNNYGIPQQEDLIKMFISNQNEIILRNLIPLCTQ